MTTIVVGPGQSSGSLSVTSGNTLIVTSGGTIGDTTVSSGGSLIVSGGTASFTTLSRGGTLTVRSGDELLGTIVSSGASIVVDTPAVASGTTLIGGSEFVGYQAVVTGTTIAAGGAEYLGEGGAASGTLIESSGIQYIGDGFATSTTVASGGFESLSQGAFASATTFESGGYAVITSGGYLDDATVSSGGVVIVEPDTFVVSPTVLAGGSVVSTGVAIVEPGSAPALYATVASAVSVGLRTEELVLAGGSAIQTTLAGAMFVFSGGHASDTTVISDGQEFADSGAVINRTTLTGPDAELTVSQTLATSTVVNSGGFLELLDGRTASTTVNSGGIEYVFSGSVDSGTLVGAGGDEAVGGTAENDTVAGTLDVGYQALATNVTIAPSGTVQIQQDASLEGSIVFSGGSGTLEVISSTTPGGVLSGFGSADRIHLDQADAIGATGTVVRGTPDQLVVSDGGSTYTFSIAGNYAGATVHLASDDGGTDVTLSGIPCFAAGTRITTVCGAVAVEDLAVGDTVVTVDDGPQPVVWIGVRRVDCRRHPQPEAILPVRIEADAFGPGRPARDLLLSPDHALYVEGVLIPVKYLVDGRCIRQVDRQEVTYFHVELPRHAVLFAEGLPAESYLDTGDRIAFSNGGAAAALYPSFGIDRADVTLMQEAAGCAPLHVTGAVVECVRAMLAGPSSSNSQAVG